jgi:hypothetical protein
LGCGRESGRPEHPVVVVGRFAPDPRFALELGEANASAAASEAMRERDGDEHRVVEQGHEVEPFAVQGLIGEGADDGKIGVVAL